MRQVVTGTVLRSFDRLFQSGSAAGRDESELLDRFLLDGDDGAFEALLTRFGPMVLTVCRRYLSDPDDVADAFQATFLVLLRRAGSIRQRALLGNWLYGVATKVARRARSKSWTRDQVERSGIAPSDVLAPDSDEPGKADDYRVLHDELARLPEKYRRPLVLCYFEGQTHEQAAARLQWPVGTVRGRLHRARERLRHRLVARGLESPVPLIATALAPPRCLLPLRLVSNTCHLARAVCLRSGWTLAVGSTPTGAVALAQGVLATSAFSPMKISALIVAAAGLLTTGVASTAYQFSGTPAAVASLPPQSPKVLKAQLQAKKSELEAADAKLELARRKAERAGKLEEKGQVPGGALFEAETQIKVEKADRDRIVAELAVLEETITQFDSRRSMKVRPYEKAAAEAVVDPTSRFQGTIETTSAGIEVRPSGGLSREDAPKLAGVVESALDTAAVEVAGQAVATSPIREAIGLPFGTTIVEGQAIATVPARARTVRAGVALDPLTTTSATIATQSATTTDVLDQRLRAIEAKLDAILVRMGGGGNPFGSSPSIEQSAPVDVASPTPTASVGRLATPAGALPTVASPAPAATPAPSLP